jgi:hypothetical protein
MREEKEEGGERRVEGGGRGSKEYFSDSLINMG